MEYTELTPFDWDLARMGASLTARDCEPLLQNDDTYLLRLDCRDFNEDWRKAVIRAVQGKAGERLVEIREEGTLIEAKIRRSSEKWPEFMSTGGHAAILGQPEAGEEYCHIIERVRALQFNRFGVNRLIRFVGNGEMEVPEKGYATFHFLNASGSVWEHAKEGDYIVYRRPGQYEVMSAEEFEAQYER